MPSTYENRLLIERLINGLEDGGWYEAVNNIFDPTIALPVGPIIDDRYIATATANGWTNGNIYDWSGETWIEIETIVGDQVYNTATSESLLKSTATTWVNNNVLNRSGVQIAAVDFGGNDEGISFMQMSSATQEYVYAIFKIPAGFPVGRDVKIEIDGFWDGDETNSPTLQINTYFRGAGEIVGGLADNVAGGGDITSDLLEFAAALTNVKIAVGGGLFTTALGNLIVGGSLAVGDIVIVSINERNQALAVATNLRIQSIYLETL